MKKILHLSLALITVLLSSISVFAGDVPEQLLYEDTTQVFLGTVVNYTTKEIPSAPYVEIATLECIPTEKIKGDVEIGVTQSYQKCYCSIDFKPDTEYLFGYFDENNVYIYEIESREGGKYKLVDSDGMTKRLESALNDGTFEKAEQKRLEKSIAKSEEADIENNPYFNVWSIVGIGVVLVILIAGVILISRKK